MKAIFKIVFTLFIIFQSCSNEPVDTGINTKDIIPVNSELYNDIDRIIKNSNSTNNDERVCIDFIYPLSLYVFNENLELLYSKFINSDKQFSDFLGNLESSQSISISYPITSIIEDGSTYSIYNNEELKDAIDTCKKKDKEDQVENCEALIRNCIWKVGLNDNGDNTYFNSVFKEENGVTQFTNNSAIYFGSWSVFFIENDLHINISLNENGEVGNYFNYNWKVAYRDENSLKLTHQNKLLILNKHCDTNNETCNDFNFKKCALQGTPNVAAFILKDYNVFINNLLQTVAVNTTIAYFETLTDANNNDNNILADHVYLNTFNNQVIYVRIENNEEETYFIIEITLTAKAC